MEWNFYNKVLCDKRLEWSFEWSIDWNDCETGFKGSERIYSISKRIKKLWIWLKFIVISKVLQLNIRFN